MLTVTSVSPDKQPKFHRVLHGDRSQVPFICSYTKWSLDLMVQDVSILLASRKMKGFQKSTTQYFHYKAIPLLDFTIVQVDRGRENTV